MLEQVAVNWVYSDVNSSDHGPELDSYGIKQWVKKRGNLIHYIKTGKPAPNGFIENFKQTYREDVLDMNLFSNLREARVITQEWLTSVNI